MNTYKIQLILKDTIKDVAGLGLSRQADKFLDMKTGKVRSSRVITICSDKSQPEIKEFAENTLKDSVIHHLHVENFYKDDAYKCYLFMAKLPGVTDDEGVSAQKTYFDYYNLDCSHGEQFIFTGDLYYIENPLSEKDLQKLGEEILGNPLINHFEYGHFDGKIKYTPTVKIDTQVKTCVVDLLAMNDRELETLSRDMLLSLDLKEMKEVLAYFQDEKVQESRKKQGLGKNPTDCELEVIGQTWSEHCKHKEFTALIHYKDNETGEEKEIDSLFKTFIYESTRVIHERYKKGGNDWILKVFNDNAGVVKIDDDNVFIWKVETHNSPSALDPYGGALTGIVGVNRDPMGTGVGGGKCLFNTNVLCFGSPYYEGDLLEGQLHPRRIMSGVVKGIEDGGNKSGIPTINGSIVFDDRFRGKPLVYCGTAAVMPMYYNGHPSWEKPIDLGDRIVMVGGRIGKDGIHGATFSSLEIDEHSPRSAVQIGSPITQKNMSDFMTRAANTGLLKSSTDNGAGGLSSSIGELAQTTNGAVIELDKAPLKYPGLQPWEIFISESQERMTFVVEPDKAEALFAMAQDFDVEITDIGYFTESGYLDILYNNERISYLDLDFLHESVPKKEMYAVWEKPDVSEPDLGDVDLQDALKTMMGRLNICSKEEVIRVYDHEVKGKTVVKPLMGETGDAPQDAGVIRVDFDSFTGIAVSNGIIPRYGDIDAYQMSAGAFDEAIRQIISVGGRLPDPESPDGIFWSVNDNFCVPDSLYDPVKNPDGKYKLAQLVKMNQALYDMATYFNIPLTSGKDSMKNDFKKGNVKISVPPTILYSMTAKIDDVRKVVTSDFKQAGDRIYLLGKTYNELGGSEFYAMMNEVGANVPQVRMADAARIYRKTMAANEAGLICSAHDCSDGGLAVALAECCFNTGTGCSVSIPSTEIGAAAECFSESHSRFVVTVPEKDQVQFEALMGDDCLYLGEVESSDTFSMSVAGETVMNVPVSELLSIWKNGLKD